MEASIMMAMMITTRQDGWQWRSPWSHGDGAHCDARGHTIHNIIWLYVCDVYFPVILFFHAFTYGGCFNHDRI